MKNKIAQDMLKFIEKSPSAFHAVENLCQLYLDKGYEQLDEKAVWALKKGGKYFAVRNQSALIAFAIPDGEICGFHMTSSHSDSPTFKVKENPEMAVEDHYIKLNTEKYGGMIHSTWMDRPLSVAGRVTVLEDGKVLSKLVNVDKDLLVIPSVAIHMNREVNNGVALNPQVDLLPLFAGDGKKDTFMKTVAKAAGVKEADILSHDLFLYVRDKGRTLGRDGEFVLSPKLDDLQCVYASTVAMIESKPVNYINICAVFDNEEVGSGTKQGADSTFLEDVLCRIGEGLELSGSEYCRLIADSFMISADNGHAVHPNHPEKADPTNRPYINGGIVIKYHGSQKYATDAMSAGVLKSLCKEADVPCQTYANRSDIAGGSTLGNISTAHVSVPTVDIGLPQLAMHSAVETGGTLDTQYAVKMFKVFYGK
ncbi:MAG: M18 family aminopeptidase [Lachnospiraceae bacterium]|nr:M18 family aminopeptidase [Lachnospiraceae bacterium]